MVAQYYYYTLHYTLHMNMMRVVEQEVVTMLIRGEEQVTLRVTVVVAPYWQNTRNKVKGFQCSHCCRLVG